MSDFTHNSWSVFVAVCGVLGILACLALLYVSAKVRVPATADNTTGHVWDGDLREMNNPLPRWWMWLFVITVVFSLGYLVAYPGLGAFSGELGWSQEGEYAAEITQAQRDLEPLYARMTGLPPEQMARDSQAMAVGERLFMNNCSQCHGSDARGSRGFPDLTDADWLYGGAPATIRETITKGRHGVMPPMAEAVGNADDVKNLAHYVLSLSGSPHDTLRAGLGKSKFTACAACHGMAGKGNPLLGAPNLTDNVWLHGWGQDAVIRMVNQGKANHMPAQEGKLTDAQIQVLASYVWGLSNKPKAP